MKLFILSLFLSIMIGAARYGSPVVRNVFEDKNIGVLKPLNKNSDRMNANVKACHHKLNCEKELSKYPYAYTLNWKLCI